MNEGYNSADKEEMRNLLVQYNNLRAGGDFQFMEEEAFEKIIDYFDDNDQLTQALEAAECGIDIFPYSSLLLIKKADLLIASRKFAESLAILDKAELLDQSDINLYILKADAYLGLQCFDKARAVLEDGIVSFKGVEKMELLFELAEVFDDYELLPEVYRCLKLILMDDPGNQEALYKICFWTDYTRSYEESIQLHKQLIDRQPYNHLAWFNLGCAFQGLKLYESAIDAYQYSIAIDEKFDYAYRNLGDAYIRIRNYKEAIDALEKVLELSIPEEVIYEALGHCHEKLRNPAQARVHYRKAVHLKSDDSHLFYHIAATYMMEENWKNAIQQLETALSILPHNPDYHFALAQCLDRCGNVKEAATHFLIYISARPRSIKGWKSLILCLNDKGYLAEALNETENAYNATRGKPVFMYYKAAILIEMGKIKDGLVHLQYALEDGPSALKEFISFNPSLLQRASVVRLINSFKGK